MKYKIEKNTVQETLILPLYSRKLCTELYQNLYRDETAVHLIDQIDYDFSEAEENSRSLMQRFGALEVAMRQNDLAFEVRAYLKNHPCAAVVNLGCGLDNTGRACDNGRCKIYNLDFPDVIALRQQLLPAGEREQNIPCDLKDPAWFAKIDASGGAVFFCLRGVLLLPDGAGQGAGAGDGGRFPLRGAGVRCRQPHGGKDDRQNVAQDGENQGCGSIFRGFGCEKRAFPVGQALTSVQPGLYVRLQRPERPFRQRLFPVSRQGRGQRDENADCEDRTWRQTMKYAGMPMGMWVLMKELGLYDMTPARCRLDYTMSEAGGVTNFVRQYTLASGGPYCDCGYKKKIN